MELGVFYARRFATGLLDRIEVEIEYMFKTRPQQHIEAVEKGVETVNSPLLHELIMVKYDSQHDKHSDRVVAAEQKVLHVFEEERDRLGEDVSKHLVDFVVAVAVGSNVLGLLFAVIHILVGLTKELGEERELRTGGVHQEALCRPEDELVRELLLTLFGNMREDRLFLEGTQDIGAVSEGEHALQVSRSFLR